MAHERAYAYTHHLCKVGICRHSVGAYQGVDLGTGARSGFGIQHESHDASFDSAGRGIRSSAIH